MYYTFVQNSSITSVCYRCMQKQREGKEMWRRCKKKTPGTLYREKKKTSRS